MANSSQSRPTEPEATPELCGGTTGFVMMILMMIVLFIMINPELRLAIAVALDGAFYPIFAFGGKYPGLTLLCTAIFMVFCSTLIRHYMTDWVGVARAQKLMSAFQKERTDAMLAGNTVKLKKLEELNPEITKKQMILMTSNLKPVIYTMIFFIVVFPWIWMIYIEEHMIFQYMTIPGITNWDMLGKLNVCPLPGFKNWIIIYILLSFPIGFLIQNGLKYISFTRKIKQAELEKERTIDDDLTALDEKLTTAESEGIQISRSRELISKVQQNIEDREYSQATSNLAEAQNYLERKTETHGRIIGLISQAESMIENAEKKGINIDSAINSLNQARKALKRNDDTSAIYYAKQSQRQVKDSRIEHKSAEESLSSVKALMYDLRELKTDEADELFNQAQTAMEKKDYSAVVKQSKTIKVKAEEIKNLHQEANSAVKNAKDSIDAIKHLELHVPQANELFEKATNALADHKYNEALELANQCNEIIKVEKDKFQEAQESVSFAKLVIANAVSFGASVMEAEKLAADAEMALTNKQYDRAIELANSAKDIAEQAKRQQQRISKRK